MVVKKQTIGSFFSPKVARSRFLYPRLPRSSRGARGFLRVGCMMRRDVVGLRMNRGGGARARCLVFVVQPTAVFYGVYRFTPSASTSSANTQNYRGIRPSISTTHDVVNRQRGKN